MSSKRYRLACVPIEDSDQPAYLFSLIRVIDRCSLGSQGSIVSSGGKVRLMRLCGCQLEPYALKSSVFM